MGFKLRRMHIVLNTFTSLEGKSKRSLMVVADCEYVQQNPTVIQIYFSSILLWLKEWESEGKRIDVWLRPFSTFSLGGLSQWPGALVTFRAFMLCGCFGRSKTVGFLFLAEKPWNWTDRRPRMDSFWLCLMELVFLDCPPPPLFLQWRQVVGLNSSIRKKGNKEFLLWLSRLCGFDSWLCSVD